jgi:hypothetical protein
LTGCSFASAFPLRPRLAFLARLALRPRLAALALRTAFARLAFFPGRALLAFFALLTFFTLLSFFASFPLLTDRPLRSGCAGLACGATFTSLTIGTILQFSQARVDAFGDLGAKLCDLGTQRRDDALRLCLDQCALTLPLLTFTVEHFSECFAPDVKQRFIAVGWRG